MSVLDVSQVKCSPCVVFVVVADGSNAGGEEVQVDVILAVRPTEAGSFYGTFQLSLNEGANSHSGGFQYELASIPYFVTVRSSGIRRCVPTTAVCVGFGLHWSDRYCAPILTLRPNKSKPLPLIMNDHGAQRPVDLGTVERYFFFLVFASLFICWFCKYNCTGTMYK